MNIIKKYWKQLLSVAIVTTATTTFLLGAQAIVTGPIAWGFNVIGSSTADLLAQNQDNEVVATLRYDGDYNDPAALLLGVPESNWFHLMSQDQIGTGFDVFDEGTYFATAPSLVFNSDGTNHNEFAIAGFASAKTMAFRASGGNKPDGTPTSDSGVGFYFAAGDAGSTGTPDGGGFIFKVGNNNGAGGSSWGAFEVQDGNGNDVFRILEGITTIKTTNNGTQEGDIAFGNNDWTIDITPIDNSDPTTLVMRKNITDYGYKNAVTATVDGDNIEIPYGSNYVQLAVGTQNTFDSIDTTQFGYGAELFLDSNGDDFIIEAGGNIVLDGGVASTTLNTGEMAKAVNTGAVWYVTKIFSN